MVGLPLSLTSNLASPLRSAPTPDAAAPAGAPGAPGAPGGEGGAPGGAPPQAPPNLTSNRRLQQTQAQVEEVKQAKTGRERKIAGRKKEKRKV